MADLEFNTASGQTVDRELLIAYLNTGTTSAPVWSPLGSRVTDSSMEYDWQEESNKDILGTTRSTMKKPISIARGTMTQLAESAASRPPRA